jgi:hypothetical protein
MKHAPNDIFHVTFWGNFGAFYSINPVLTSGCLSISAICYVTCYIDIIVYLFLQFFKILT